MVKGRHGKDLLMMNGYTYYQHKLLRDGFRWSCTQMGSRSCRGFLHVTSEMLVIRAQTEHTHPPSTYFLEKFKSRVKTVSFLNVHFLPHCLCWTTLIGRKQHRAHIKCVFWMGLQPAIGAFRLRSLRTNNLTLNPMKPLPNRSNYFLFNKNDQVKLFCFRIRRMITFTRVGKMLTASRE